MVAAAAFICAAAQAAEPLPDRRAVRPGAVPTAGAPRTDTLLDLVTQIEMLQEQVRQLRGQLEVQTHELEQLQVRNRDALADFDRRLREAERPGLAAAPAAPVGAVVPATAPNAVSAPPPRAPASATEQQEYNAAFALMKKGLYERATKSFKEFLARYPRGALADNAQYWLAEAAYATFNYRKAIEEFNRVLSDYPSSPKGPDALLKVGYSHYEIGALDQARSTLEQVIARFPNTRVAKAAEERLSKIAKEPADAARR